MSVAGSSLLLAACGSHEKHQLSAIHRPAPTRIVDLPRGSIAAAPDSPEYALAKFMASSEAPPRTFRFDTAQFAPWSDQMTPRTRGTLSTIILILNNYPNAMISLSGYTDNDGSADANLALSQRRADRLKRLLVDGGVSQAAIKAVGKGMADPIGDNDTVAGRALNRRIELTVTAKE